MAVKARGYDMSNRRRQAAETRRRIIDAAYGLFIQRGYGKSTLSDIAARAGVAVETVYAAFGNKAERYPKVNAMLDSLRREMSRIRNGG